MAKTIAQDFLDPVVNCGSIYNAGSTLLVGKLVNCAEEPEVIEVTVATAVVIGDEEIDLTFPASTIEVVLRAGSRLYFGTSVDAAVNYVVFVNDVIIPSSATPTALTNIAIEPAETAIATTDTGFTWALVAVLSPSNLPINIGSNMTNRKDLTYGLQGSEVKTGITLTSQIQLIAQPEDRAYWDILLPAATGSQLVFALILRSGGQHAFGKAQVGETSNDGAIDEISRPQVNLAFQAPFSIPTLYQYLDADRKVSLNRLRKYAGLPILA